MIEVGAATDPCTIGYPGPKPFSEPETRALATFVKTFDNIKLYLAFHQFGQLVLFPRVSKQSITRKLFNQKKK